jgi:hypothetical protein
MIKRKKPLLRKAPIKRSTEKRVAPLYKKCDVGNHEVPSLFRSRTKNIESCCKNCIAKSTVNKNVSKKVLSKPQKDSISDLIEKTQKVFNAAIRKRDSRDGFFECISCSKTFPVDVMDAGHFLTIRYSAIRFNEDACHGQCHYCNRLEYGNYEGFKIGLLSRIGEVRMNAVLDQRHIEVKWDRSKLLEIIKKYK